VHEREGNRRHNPLVNEIELDSFAPSSPADPLAFLDPRAPRLRFAIGE